MLNRLKIRHKVLLLVLALNLALTLSFSFYAYSALKQVTLQGIDQKLLAGASALQQIFPADYHSKIKNPQSVAGEEYFGYVQKLTQFARQNDFFYLYTYMIIDGKVVTTSTSATEKEWADKSYVPFFKPYDPTPANLIKAFLEMKIYFQEYRDEFGHFRSAFVPFKASDGRIFVAGADIAMNAILDQFKAHLRNCVFIGLIIFAVSILFSLLLADRIAQPLVELAAYTKSMADTSFSLTESAGQKLKRLTVKKRDEVGALAEAFIDMDKMLKQYLHDLTETTAARERLQSELNIAHDIQMSFLKKVFPAFKDRTDFDLYATLEPAKEVGGDLYDFHLIDDDHLYLCVGDVSDKGVPAALLMAVTMTMMKAAVLQKVLDPAKILTQANRELCEENESLMFVTVFCAVLNLKTGEMVFSNAGHNPPLILRKDNTAAWLKLPDGIVLGVAPEFVYQNSSYQFLSGDILLTYTDGVTEAKNPASQLFSDDRLLAMGGPLGTKSPSDVVHTLMQAIRQFADGAPQSDDITVLAMEYKAQPSRLAEMFE